MAIYLTTGQPGHGKTAYAVWKAFQWKEEGRDVYVAGIKDFDYEGTGCKPLEDPKLWQDLPDGSVVILDECYTDFPNRNPGAKVPDHVEALARHRHRGFDFMMIAQQSIQLDPFIRGLIEEHVHVRQTSLLKKNTRLRRWNKWQSNVGGPCNDEENWTRPDFVFKHFTSTVMVTTKRRLPTWLRTLALALLGMLALLLVVKWHFQTKIEAATASYDARNDSGKGAAGLPGSLGQGGAVAPHDGTAPRYETPTQYADAHLPRFASMPWTAPVFDQRPTTVDPQLMCMSGSAGELEGGRSTGEACVCFTEQGTLYEMPRAQCLRTARHGPPYNPYKQLRGDAPSAAPVGFPAAVAAAPGASVGIGDPELPVQRYGAFRGVQTGPDKAYEMSAW